MAEVYAENDRIIEIPRMSMFTKPLQGSNRSPRLSWCCLRGNPRITVFLNGPDSLPNKGIISSPMDPTAMEDLLACINKVAESEPGNKPYRMTCWTSPRVDKGNSAVAAEKVLLSEVIIGRDDKGIVWISCQAKDMPKVKFEFRLSDYHEMFIGDQPMSEGEASALHAKSFTKILSTIYPKLIAETDMKAVTQAMTEYKDKQKVTSTFSTYDDDIAF